MARGAVVRDGVAKKAVGRIDPLKVREKRALTAEGRCLCGAVRIEIGVPARWAWHDHSKASRLAHGAAYATYVGSWRSKFRVIAGAGNVGEFHYEDGKRTRSFCKTCGTPVFYAYAHAPQMVNVPRALFESGTGREPLYHIAIDEAPEWAYSGAPLGPLKGYPGVVWERPRKKKRGPAGLF